MALKPKSLSWQEAAETKLRIDMAAGFRWLDKWGMSDLIAGSIVARLPGTDNELFTHPHDYHFDEICAGDMIKTDFANGGGGTGNYY